MAFLTGGSGEDDEVLADINVTPLVDVMLVLLVIFIITAPLLSYAIKLELPNDPAPASEPAPATVKLSIDAGGAVFWDDEPVSDAELSARLEAAAKSTTLPELHLRADKATRYERISFVLSSAHRAGLAKIGFVTDPAQTGAAK